jgi:hypothetical protein
MGRAYVRAFARAREATVITHGRPPVKSGLASGRDDTETVDAIHDQVCQSLEPVLARLSDFQGYLIGMNSFRWFSTS